MVVTLVEGAAVDAVLVLLVVLLLVVVLVLLAVDLGVAVAARLLLLVIIFFVEDVSAGTGEDELSLCGLSTSFLRGLSTSFFILLVGNAMLIAS